MTTEEYKSYAKKLGFPYKRKTWFDADHIVPVVEGGGLCDLSNIRTLCIPCHKKVTKELAKRLALRRKGKLTKRNKIQLPPSSLFENDKYNMYKMRERRNSKETVRPEQMS